MTGPITLDGKTPIYKGRPLVAGDLNPGDVVEYDRENGEVLNIKRAARDETQSGSDARQDDAD
jgi:hypothetical protein